MRYADLDHRAYMDLDATLAAIRRACARHDMTVAEVVSECEQISTHEEDTSLWGQGPGTLGALAAWLANEAPRKVMSCGDALWMWREQRDGGAG